MGHETVGLASSNFWEPKFAYFLRNAEPAVEMPNKHNSICDMKLHRSDGGAEPINGKFSQFLSIKSWILQGGFHQCHDKNVKAGMLFTFSSIKAIQIMP